jgi:cytochrome P450
MVMVCPMAVHLDPEVFEDPLSFNPWRWQVRNIEENYYYYYSVSVLLVIG